MSSRDKIYFNRDEYNKLMQIINDNKNSNDEEIKYRANQLIEKFEEYVFVYEKQTKGKLEKDLIYITNTNQFKYLVKKCMYLVSKKAKKDYYEELRLKSKKE